MDLQHPGVPAPFFGGLVRGLSTDSQPFKQQSRCFPASCGQASPEAVLARHTQLIVVLFLLDLAPKHRLPSGLRNFYGFSEVRVHRRRPGCSPHRSTGLTILALRQRALPATHLHAPRHGKQMQALVNEVRRMSEEIELLRQDNRYISGCTSSG